MSRLTVIGSVALALAFGGAVYFVATLEDGDPAGAPAGTGGAAVAATPSITGAGRAGFERPMGADPAADLRPSGGSHRAAVPPVDATETLAGSVRTVAVTESGECVEARVSGARDVVGTIAVDHGTGIDRYALSVADGRYSVDVARIGRVLIERVAIDGSACTVAAPRPWVAWPEHGQLDLILSESPPMTVHFVDAGTDVALDGVDVALPGGPVPGTHPGPLASGGRLPNGLRLLVEGAPSPVSIALPHRLGELHFADDLFVRAPGFAWALVRPRHSPGPELTALAYDGGTVTVVVGAGDGVALPAGVELRVESVGRGSWEGPITRSGEYVFESFRAGAVVAQLLQGGASVTRADGDLAVRGELALALPAAGPVPDGTPAVVVDGAASEDG